jgi:hypothetical protein
MPFVRRFLSGGSSSGESYGGSKALPAHPKYQAAEGVHGFGMPRLPSDLSSRGENARSERRRIDFTGVSPTALLGRVLVLCESSSIHAGMPNMPASGLFVGVGDPTEHWFTEAPPGELDAVRQAFSREPAGEHRRGAREVHRHREVRAPGRRCCPCLVVGGHGADLDLFRYGPGRRPAGWACQGIHRIEKGRELPGDCRLPLPGGP